MKVILIGVCHTIQWKDPTGELRDLVERYIKDSKVELIAEESVSLPTTVSQRLACGYEIPWLEIDFNIAERKLENLQEGLSKRPYAPLNPGINGDLCEDYLPVEDGKREEEWVRRIDRYQCACLLCLCGVMHVQPFSEKLKARGYDVETLDLTEHKWFQKTCGRITVVEQKDRRWCETRI